MPPILSGKSLFGSIYPVHAPEAPISCSDLGILPSYGSAGSHVPHEPYRARGDCGSVCVTIVKLPVMAAEGVFGAVFPEYDSVSHARLHEAFSLRGVIFVADGISRENGREIFAYARRDVVSRKYIPLFARKPFPRVQPAKSTYRIRFETLASMPFGEITQVVQPRKSDQSRGAHAESARIARRAGDEIDREPGSGAVRAEYHPAVRGESAEFGNEMIDERVQSFRGARGAVLANAEACVDYAETFPGKTRAELLSRFSLRVGEKFAVEINNGYG